MTLYDVLRNRFLKNILILVVVVVVALISFNLFYITPSFTRLLINTTQHDAVRITRHLASSLLVSDKTEIGRENDSADKTETTARYRGMDEEEERDALSSGM